MRSQIALSRTLTRFGYVFPDEKGPVHMNRCGWTGSHISYFLYCIASVVELFVNVILDVIIKEQLGQWSWSREETNALGLGPADGFVSPGQGDVRRNTDMTDFFRPMDRSRGWFAAIAIAL